MKIRLQLFLDILLVACVVFVLYDDSRTWKTTPAKQDRVTQFIHSGNHYYNILAVDYATEEYGSVTLHLTGGSVGVVTSQDWLEAVQ